MSKHSSSQQSFAKFKHPAWTPVSVDGSAITSASADDYQALGTGSADKVVGGNTFKGDAGQSVHVDRRHTTGDTIEDHSGDGDCRGANALGGLRDAGERARSRASCRPAWVWLPAMLRTRSSGTPISGP